MRRTITFLVAAVIISAIPDTLGAQKKRRQQRDINSVRTEQRDTKREIAETSKKITANTRETSRQLARLNTLSGEIATTTREISRMQHGVDSLDGRIAATADSIASLQTRVETLRQTYAKALRSTQGSNGARNTLPSSSPRKHSATRGRECATCAVSASGAAIRPNASCARPTPLNCAARGLTRFAASGVWP